MRMLADARLKRTRAVELLAQGNNYDQIAQAVGYSNRGSAHRAVRKALAEREIEAIDGLRGLRALELARLDALHAAHWHAALDGDVESALVLLKISAERRRWYGVEKPQPVRGSQLYGGEVLVQPEAEGNTRAETAEQPSNGFAAGTRT